MANVTREQAQRLLRIQRAQLDRLSASQMRQTLAILREARREIEERLALGAAGADATFTRERMRQTLAQLRVAIADLERRLGDEIRRQGAESYKLAIAHFWRQMSTFGGNVGRFDAPRPADFGTPRYLDDTLLLLQHDASIQAYGAGLVQRIQQRLVTLAAAQAPWTTMVRDIAGIGGILDEDIRGGQFRETKLQSRAERIVRTELIRAYNAGHYAQLVEVDRGDPDGGWLKQLVATFDRRTGDDSVFVHGQVRKPEQPFRDNRGREYMYPPNRPNDREVMIVTRREYIAEGLGGTTAEEAEAAAQREEAA